MQTPNWFGLVLLSLASFRIWRLIAVDTVTEQIRYRITRTDEYLKGNPAEYREKLDEFISCPWCFGFWIVLAWWGLWQVWDQAVYVMSVPLALSTLVGFLAKAD